MSDETPAADEVPVTFHVKSSGNSKYTVTLPLSTTALDLKNKLATAEYANIPPECQRLIYSGRVLKDADTLASHKVKEGNTMHLVKSAPSNQRQNPTTPTSSTASSGVPTSSSPAPSAVPTNLAAGTGGDFLAGVTGARYAGYGPQLPGLGAFGPDGGMGPPPSPEQMIEMLSNPQNAQMMAEALRNPQMIEMMIQASPQLRAMGPAARDMLQSDYFRRMMTDPTAMRRLMELQRSMGMDPSAAFPALGVTSRTDSQYQGQNANSGSGQSAGGQTNPMAALLGGAGGAQAGNPFSALLNPAAGTPNNTSSGGTEGANNDQSAQNPFATLSDLFRLGQQLQSNQAPGTSSPAVNPFMANNPLLNNPDLLNQFWQAMGNNDGAGAGGVSPWANAFGDLGRLSSPPAPADTRPPEERYAEQLRQLNEMGFYDFDRNVQALSRSGGNLEVAVNHLLGL